MTISLTTIIKDRRKVGADLDEDLWADYVQRDKDLAEMIFPLIGVNGRTTVENSGVYTVSTLSLGSWSRLYVPDWATKLQIRFRAKVSAGQATFFAEFGTAPLTSSSQVISNTSYGSVLVDPELTLTFSDISSLQDLGRTLVVKADGDTNPMTIFLTAALGPIHRFYA